MMCITALMHTIAGMLDQAIVLNTLQLEQRALGRRLRSDHPQIVKAGFQEVPQGQGHKQKVRQRRRSPPRIGSLWGHTP